MVNYHPILSQLIQHYCSTYIPEPQLHNCVCKIAGCRAIKVDHDSAALKATAWIGADQAEATKGFDAGLQERSNDGCGRLSEGENETRFR